MRTETYPIGTLAMKNHTHTQRKWYSYITSALASIHKCKTTKTRQKCKWPFSGTLLTVNECRLSL